VFSGGGRKTEWGGNTWNYASINQGMNHNKELMRIASSISEKENGYMVMYFDTLHKIRFK
jgi:hypothetical protein